VALAQTLQLYGHWRQTEGAKTVVMLHCVQTPAPSQEIHPGGQGEHDEVLVVKLNYNPYPAWQEKQLATPEAAPYGADPTKQLAGNGRQVAPPPT
jgi:hypothetical protein